MDAAWDNDDGWWHQQDLEAQQYEEFLKLVALFLIVFNMEKSDEAF